MLSTYVNGLADRGLVLDRVLEPRPDDGWVGERSEAARLPVHLVARCLLKR